jgi:hypothetical protein
MKRILLIFLNWFLVSYAFGSDTLKIYVNAYNCKYCNLINSHIIQKYGNTDLEIIILTNAKSSKEFEYYTKLKYSNVVFSQSDSPSNFTIVNRELSVSFDRIDNLDNFLNFNWLRSENFFPPTATGYLSEDTLSIVSKRGQVEIFKDTQHLSSVDIRALFPPIERLFDSLYDFHKIQNFLQIFEIIQSEWIEIENVSVDLNSLMIRVNDVVEIDGDFEVQPVYYLVNNLDEDSNISKLATFQYKGSEFAPFIWTRFAVVGDLLYVPLSKKPYRGGVVQESYAHEYYSFGLFDVSSGISQLVEIDSTFRYTPSDFDERGSIKFHNEVIKGDEVFFGFKNSDTNLVYEPEQNFIFPLAYESYLIAVAEGFLVVSGKNGNELFFEVFDFNSGFLYDRIAVKSKNEIYWYLPVYDLKSSRVSGILYNNSQEGLFISSPFELIPIN